MCNPSYGECEPNITPTPSELIARERLDEHQRAVGPGASQIRRPEIGVELAAEV
jgi:hypothetical protein